MICSEENKYLKRVLKQIDIEINILEEKLKELYKTGISLSFEDKKRGEHLNVNAQLTRKTEQIESLKKSIPIPYFGRIDLSFSDDLNNKQKFYIGRKGISSDSEVLVTDWRAPISSLYYDSEIGHVEYLSPSGIVDGYLSLKRQINIKDSELVDVLDTDLVTDDELLKPYLDTNADSKMKTIIASIQKEQNYVIRRPIEKNIIVQGVAGSGKTSIALHRIAYLIYALNNKVKSTEFLVLGPNKYFLNYISSILPELETSSVEQKTFLELLNETINEKLVLDESYVNSNVDKSNSKFMSSLKFKDALDRFVKNYLDEKIVTEGIVMKGEEVFSVKFVRNILFSTSAFHPDFSSACLYTVKKFKDNLEEIYDKLNEKYRKIYMNLPEDDYKRKDTIKKSEELYIFLKSKGVKCIKEYFKKINVKIIDLYKYFIINLEMYTNDLSLSEMLSLKNRTLSLLKKKRISFEDMAALMYLSYKLHGSKNSYQHIVIDEAQDYGLFHFAVLKEMFPKSSYSIYGDLAQAIYSYRSIENWESVVNMVFDNNCELINISKSYRTTTEITENANQILNLLNLKNAKPVIRHGKDVRYLDKTSDDEYKFQKISSFKNMGYKSIAIICKTDAEAKKIFTNLSSKSIEVTQITAKDNEYNGGVCVLTSSLAKGLEFDVVIINNASSKVYDIHNKVDMHLLYVACTRALHELEILYDKELCSVFNLIREPPKVDY